jgi:cell division protein FtsW
MNRERNHIDRAILLSVVTLMVLSLGVVYSASSSWALLKWGASDKLLGNHALKVLIGFLVIFAAIHIDYHHLLRLTKPVLLVAVGLLALTLFAGATLGGAVRWLPVAGVSVQTSELARYALLIHICTLFARKGETIRDLKSGYLPLLVWVGVVTLLVLRQPNFSTAAMIVAVSLLQIYIGGARRRHMAVTVAAAIPLLGLYMFGADYRMRRVLGFLHGMPDAGGAGNYQVWQGIIGFGNGGLFGLGPGGSRQRDLFLPESYGDFVFSIVGEEYGLVGTLTIMLLFVVIMFRGMKIARHARDPFGRSLAIGITSSIALYALVNAGVTLGLLPTTGLPMPFVSYGGSSMILSGAVVGLLLNISSQTDLHPRLSTPRDGTRQPVGRTAGGEPP